ncbi:MAG: hypothetical protein M0042_08960 [Nitrospiraceae bacterium]|nr:hypothetical protein [Nitrospiraceae bacterium]
MKSVSPWILAVVLIGSLAAGCSPETRYRTLSFFFDGVPPPGGSGQELRSGRATGEPKEPPKVRPTTHGPYAARLCEACHQRGSGNKLILPVEELCLKCHVVSIAKKNVHGPLASGGCRVCHEPHGSGKAYLLVADPTTFCFYCHDEQEVGTRDVHKASGGAECTECHDAHSSDNPFLLK